MYKWIERGNSKMRKKKLEKNWINVRILLNTFFSSSLSTFVYICTCCMQMRKKRGKIKIKKSAGEAQCCRGQNFADFRNGERTSVPHHVGDYIWTEDGTGSAAQSDR